jgi:hypothetical protein
MGYIKGEGPNQRTLFPVVFDDFVPADHVCRVIDAFDEKLVMSSLASSGPKPIKTADQNNILTAFNPAKSTTSPTRIEMPRTASNLGARQGFIFSDADLHFADSAIA